MNTEARILAPGQVEAPAGEIRFLFLPGRDLFARRAKRLRFLSKGHPLGDYLAFLSILADAQQEALIQFLPLSLPGCAEQARCLEQGMPLLDARFRQRDPEWRRGLAMILQQMSKADLPSAARHAASTLMQASETELEERADRILAADLAAVSPQDLPFIAAALQVYWVQMASSLKEDAFGRLEQGGLCPVCGSYPGAGIVHRGGAEQGLRYLSCSLCASEWHMVRIKCSSCESTRGIDYHIVEGSNGAIKAESCGDCNFYLKLLYLGKDSQMEAMADDLATLALDMLMDKEGKARGGPNLFFHPGRSL
ncbi:MAG TPA: formate dehydrogenase accessory protein FdhE [Nitrospirota bacterium]|nr:formate dehydrogenase accessory protein FdhE [Nitrospirota bacterium]